MRLIHRMLLVTSVVGLAAGSPPAYAEQKLLVKAFIITDKGNRLDFRVPVGETIKVTRPSGESYRLTASLGRSVDDVDFDLTRTDVKEEGHELINLKPGLQQAAASLGPGFVLGLDRVSIEATARPSANLREACISCTVIGCGITVTCELCDSPGWCCEISCNGTPICTVCQILAE